MRSVEVETRTRGELKGLSREGEMRVNIGFLRAFLLTFNAIIIIL